MTAVINPDFAVIESANGNHFHLFDDCGGCMLGWTTHTKQGNDVFTTFRLTGESALRYSDAVKSGLFGCKVCHKRAGVEVPAECDRIKVRAARKEARELRKLANVDAVEVAPVATDDDIKARISELMAELEMLRSLSVAA